MLSGAGVERIKHGMPDPLRWDTPGLNWDTPGLFWDGFAPASNTPMPITEDNRISATMTAQDITDINAALTTIRNKLPFLMSVSNQERQEMAKMGDKSVGFDEKCAAYMVSNPEYLPGFIQIAEINKDRALRAQLLQFFPNLKTLCEAADDTMMVLGSEVWMADLAYYQNVREGARRGRAGADTIYNDLRTRFPGGNPQPTPTPPTP